MLFFWRYIMASQIGIRCVLVKTGKSIIGVGLSTSTLNEEGRSFCKKTHEKLSRGKIERIIPHIITFDGAVISFTCSKKNVTTVSFDLGSHATALKTLLRNNASDLDLRFCPYPQCGLKIVLSGLNTGVQDIFFDEV